MIRAYTGEDQEKLSLLLRLNTPLYFHPAEEQDFIYYLENHAQNYFVVEHANTIIGCGGINYFDGGKTARISWDINILGHHAPECAGKRVWPYTNQYRIDQIKSNPTVERIVVRTTQMVYRFYQKSGFELIKTEKDFWAEDFDLYQMELKIK